MFHRLLVELNLTLIMTGLAHGQDGIKTNSIRLNHYGSRAQIDRAKKTWHKNSTQIRARASLAAATTASHLRSVVLGRARRCQPAGELPELSTAPVLLPLLSFRHTAARRKSRTCELISRINSEQGRGQANRQRDRARFGRKATKGNFSVELISCVCVIRSTPSVN